MKQADAGLCDEINVKVAPIIRAAGLPPAWSPREHQIEMTRGAFGQQVSRGACAQCTNSAIARGEMRVPPIASECVVLGGNLSGLVLRVRRDDSDPPAGPAEVVFRSGRQTKQRAGLADFYGPIRNDFQLVIFGNHQSAVRAGAW